MARYKSILQFRGSLDGLVFYQLNGVPVVRKRVVLIKIVLKPRTIMPEYEKTAVNLVIVLKLEKC
jgi:hypothetical protein